MGGRELSILLGFLFVRYCCVMIVCEVFMCRFIVLSYVIGESVCVGICVKYLLLC